MRNEPTTVAHESATAPPRKRYRSWLYLAMHGPENHVWGLTVCTDYRMACLILSGQDHGDILIVSPDEGARVRQFLSTGKPWDECPDAGHDGISGFRYRQAGEVLTDNFAPSGRRGNRRSTAASDTTIGATGRPSRTYSARRCRWSNRALLGRVGRMQLPLNPRAGFVAEVPPPAPYPEFPSDPLGRVRWAEEAPLRSVGAKALLMVLARMAHADGAAWPSVATLAQRVSMSRRGVQKALRSLTERGWLAVGNTRAEIVAVLAESAARKAVRRMLRPPAGQRGVVRAVRLRPMGGRTQFAGGELSSPISTKRRTK